MTHSFPTRRSSDLVVAEALPDHLLDEEGLFIGAAARRNAADRACAILRLDTAKLARGVSDGFVPAHLAPRLADRGPDHRFQYAVLMLRIAPGEPAFHAAVTAVRLAVLPQIGRAHVCT